MKRMSDGNRAEAVPLRQIVDTGDNQRVRAREVVRAGLSKYNGHDRPFGIICTSRVFAERA